MGDLTRPISSVGALIRWGINKSLSQTVEPFSVGLLKGKAWEGHEHMAARHRSCQVASKSQRVLLTLDPL